MLEGIICRYWWEIAWRDLPKELGRNGPFERGVASSPRDRGTWDAIVQALIARVDAERLVGWSTP